MIPWSAIVNLGSVLPFLTVRSCWTSSAELLLDMPPPLDEAAFALVDVAVGGVAGASAPNPESKLGFLAAALLLQFFIPLAEDDAVLRECFRNSSTAFCLSNYAWKKTPSSTNDLTTDLRCGASNVTALWYLYTPRVSWRIQHNNVFIPKPAEK